MSYPKVLVVDDDLPLRLLMQNLLREFRFEPLLAASGEEAIELIRRDRPSVVLLDLHMPGLSGEETMARLRAEGLDEVPVLILSGEPLSPTELSRIGARGAVQKPFDLPQLVDALRAATGPVT